MKPGDQFRSDGGVGPYIATVIAVQGGQAHLVRRPVLRLGNKRDPVVRFSLPLWFFDSPACGWR